MVLRKGMFAVLGMILAMATFATAQEQQPPAAPQGIDRAQTERLEQRRERLRQREGRVGQRGFGHRDSFRFMRELNLSEAQQQQRKAIVERRLESIKSQREELIKLREKRTAGTFAAEDEIRAKALKQEIRSSREAIRNEMESVLTAEQKAKLEELQKEGKARMEQRMQERQQRLQERLNKRDQPF